MMAWSPEAWNGVSVVGLAVFGAVMFVVAVLRGWIVLGKTHREIVDRLDGRAAKDAETIGKLSTAITEKNATEEAAKTILSSVREALTNGAGR